MTTLEIRKPFALNPLLIVGALGVAALALLFYELRDRGVATLRLETDPRDAVVSVDGERAVGVVSPFVISELAASVNHTIAVEKPGYVGWSTRLRVGPDKTYELPLVKLERVQPATPLGQAPNPNPATAAPPNVAVLAAKPSIGHVDRADKTEGSRTRREAAPARHIAHAQFRQPRAAESKPSAAVAPAAAAGGKAGMGTLRINTRPWSQVKVDGRSVGNTPQMNLQLSAGSHTVTLTNPDFGVSKTVVIDIKPDSTVTRVLTLAP